MGCVYTEDPVQDAPIHSVIDVACDLERASALQLYMRFLFIPVQHIPKLETRFLGCMSDTEDLSDCRLRVLRSRATGDKLWGCKGCGK